MQLGKELTTGFVTDDAQAHADGEAGLPDEADARVPEASALPAQETEPAAAS